MNDEDEAERDCCCRLMVCRGGWIQNDSSKESCSSSIQRIVLFDGRRTSCLNINSDPPTPSIPFLLYICASSPALICLISFSTSHRYSGLLLHCLRHPCRHSLHTGMLSRSQSRVTLGSDLSSSKVDILSPDLDVLNLDRCDHECSTHTQEWILH